MLRIGDRVKFLSQTGVGIITKIEKDIVWVDVEDGFELPIQINDVVAVSKEQELEALASFGEDDNRPGTKKGKPKPKKTREVKVEREAYKRYGKITLVNEEDMEDDEELIDLHEIKERYVKNLLATQRREREIEEEKQKINDAKSRTIEEGEAEDIFTPKTIIPATKDKLKTISLEELATKEKTEKKTLKDFLKQPKQVEEPEMDVIDLHAEQILDSLEGVTSAEIITAQLARFSISLETRIKSNKKGKVVYIHGIGKGRLRYEIEKKIKSSYPKLNYQDASFKEYGYGAILIYY